VAEAVPAHRVHRAAWYARLVGPFLLGADRIAATGRAAGEEPLDVMLVVREGPAALAAALPELAVWPVLRLVGVELGPAPSGTPADSARECCDALDLLLWPGAAGVVELRRGPGLEAALDVVASRGYRAKYRTGGVEPQAFPSVEELAAFVIGCTQRGLAFKCTAGLHHAVRHTDPATGFTHHGFLNILAATRAARRGEPARVVELLASRSGDELAAEISALTDRQTGELAAAVDAKGDRAAFDQTSDHRIGGHPPGDGSYVDDPTGGDLPDRDLPDRDLPGVDPTGGDTTGGDRTGGGRARDRRIHDLRALFTAYGTCSISEPLDDLAALGLIALPEKNLDHG
jgi:hypothetical protein